MRDDASHRLPQMTVAERDSMAGRTRRLLNEARYLNLATVSADGSPWVATLEYAWLADPLRFVFGSATAARHSRDIVASPYVGGSLFVTGRTTGAAFAEVDGSQFTGRCTEIPAAELERYHSVFYEAVFPDPRQRAEWMLPQSSLRVPAAHRLYLIEVERWWLIDTQTWERDGLDQRVELPLAALPTL